MVVCYHGNNGGDGFVTARFLCDVCDVDLLFLGDESKLSEESLANYHKAVENDKIQLVDTDINFDDYDIIVDALLGTGISGYIREPIKNVIIGINKSTAKKVCIDIPSGMDPDTGKVIDVAVQPDLVIALHDIKKGAILLKDKTKIADIGL